MTSTIEIELMAPDETLISELRSFGHEILHEDRGDKQYYCVSLGKGYWKKYKIYLLNYTVKNLSWIRIEFDRAGDLMDKNLVYEYVGHKMFSVTYKTDDLQYSAYHYFS